MEKATATAARSRYLAQYVVPLSGYDSSLEASLGLVTIHDTKALSRIENRCPEWLAMPRTLSTPCQA
jgi:hypothetical protein